MSYPTAPDPCASCGARLWSEARFCHRCGAQAVPGALEPVGRDGSTTPHARRPTPELLLALLAIGALVAMVVGQRLGLGRPTAADSARADSALSADSLAR